MALLLAACAGSAAEERAGGFRVVDVSLTSGLGSWRINRPIDIRFSQDVDFATVGFNSVRIRDLAGRPAVGTFGPAPGPDGGGDPRVVRFQPACPTRADSSDAGLLPGGVTYELAVLGAGQGLGLRSTSGQPLEGGYATHFRTPTSNDPSQLFLDPVPGPPEARLRGRGKVADDALDATFLELGGDPDRRVYFAFDAGRQEGRLPAGFEVPLNQYADPTTRVAVVVFLNQPVQPAEENFGSDRVSLQYRDPRNLPTGPEWVTAPTRVRLVANCTETGAELRLEPRGLLPQGADLRLRLGPGFSDLAGGGLDQPRTQAARMTTRVARHPTLPPAELDADAFYEPFLTLGPDSVQDTDAAFADPPAEWADGVLRASFGFDGSGGTGGSFDWTAPPGLVVLDTTLTQLSGSSGAQTVIGGIFDVRDFIVPAGSRVVFQGPNPVHILATGRVSIAGELRVRGSNSPGVGTLNTAHLPEPGGVGQAGGGRGGTGSFLTSQSTPRGGSGFGPFGKAGSGGQGGAACFFPTGPDDRRRAAGGGGGRFGADLLYPFTLDGVSVEALCQTLTGMDAEPGFGGSGSGTSAATLIGRALGGDPAPSPFVDGEAENDFFGALLVQPGQGAERLVRGELDRVWAGSGGGAGGDGITSSVFPPPVFTVAGDEKGAGGGGAGGGLRISSIGPIEVASGGRIVADGGHGGGGENTTGAINRIGGGSGGGSGGHIVLSSAAFISIDGSADHAGSSYNDDLDTP